MNLCWTPPPIIKICEWGPWALTCIVAFGGRASSDQAAIELAAILDAWVKGKLGTEKGKSKGGGERKTRDRKREVKGGGERKTRDRKREVKGGGGKEN